MSPQAMKNISTAPSTASESSASTSTSASVPHHNYGHGFRSQIGQFLPKHVLFQVHLHIDQLSNVPLISGEFAVRWKFKNVQSSSGLLSKMKGNRSWPGMGRKGKGKNRDTGFEIEVTPAEDEDEAQMEDADEESGAQESEDEFTQDEHTDSAEFGGYLTSSPPDTPNPTATSTPASPLKTNPTTSPATQSDARGMTDWAKLYSYNVKWERRLNVAVQMDVHRETGDLLPNELKLVVMQRIIPGDPNSPRQPRVGAVYLNLAEYADQGPVTRRYLLRQSKTNATLKLTIELEHIGGEKHYRPPPLRKGEILASVSGLLSNNELLRTSVARQLDEYTRGDLPDEDSRLHPFMHGDGHADGDRLATSYGLRSTEDLIEALFNPVPTSRPTPSPFTYFAPQHNDVGSADTSSDSLSLTNGIEPEQQSMNSVSADSASAHTGGSVGSAQELATAAYVIGASGSSKAAVGDASKTWWRKMRSRHGTPTTRNLKPPPHLPRQAAEPRGNTL
ncbi:hypothetical protein AcV5_009593 [Taiwanofungus camphoratus]|nr:hypothetical protein AcV5_009593 [Antrodia cinnamomea]